MGAMHDWRDPGRMRPPPDNPPIPAEQEIRQLRIELKRCQEALREIAKFTDDGAGQPTDSGLINTMARSALSQPTSPNTREQETDSP